MKDLSKLEKEIKVKFKDKNLILKAVTHRSFLNENKGYDLDHNERLEFLGDAILELIVTEYLYKNYPNPEGELTNWRASLVNRSSLAETAENLQVMEFMQMSRGEAKDKNPKSRQYILANALEAIIGAIYLDQGMEKTKIFIDENINKKLDNILKNKLYIDPKSDFQEKAQEKVGITPVYRVLKSSGPDHAKTFEVGVYLDKTLIAKGKGLSKQEAQTNAAKNALNKKKW